MCQQGPQPAGQHHRAADPLWLQRLLRACQTQQCPKYPFGTPGWEHRPSQSPALAAPGHGQSRGRGRCPSGQGSVERLPELAGSPQCQQRQGCPPGAAVPLAVPLTVPGRDQASPALPCCSVGRQCHPFHSLHPPGGAAGTPGRGSGRCQSPLHGLGSERELLAHTSRLSSPALTSRGTA